MEGVNFSEINEIVYCIQRAWVIYNFNIVETKFE